MTQQINLLGPQLRRQRRSANRAAVLAPIFLVAVATGLGGAAFFKHRTKALREQHAVNDAAIRSEQQQQQRLSQEVAKLAKDPALEAEAAQIERRLLAVRLDLGALKDGVIGDTRGFSAFMRALAHQGVEGVWLTGFSVGAAGQDISITGRALRAELVPAYLKRLGQDAYFSGRSFAALDMAQGRAEAQGQAAGSALAFSLMSRRERTPVPERPPVAGMTPR